MMLWVVRHAVAMDRGDYHQQYGGQAADEMRPLTEDGIKKMRKQAKGLGLILPRPEFLISSPLTRAEETTQILQAIWPRVKVQMCDALRPDSTPSSFIRWCASQLRGSDIENSDMVIVGHNPGLPILIRYLITGEETGERDAHVELKKGGVCCLEFPGKIEKGEGRLLGLLTPKILRVLVSG